MKIGNQSVHDAKTVAWRNKKTGVPRVWLKAELGAFVQPRYALQYTHGRGADSDDTPTSAPRLVDQFRRRSIQVDRLAVHLMLADILALDGPERIQSHVQRDEANSYPLPAQLLQQVWCKVQSRRGCGSRATDTRVNRLVALWIVQRLVDIGRQGHATPLLNELAHGQGR